MKVNDWKIMENITREIFPPENANFSILVTRNVIGQGTLRCSEILRESRGRLLGGAVQRGTTES